MSGNRQFLIVDDEPMIVMLLGDYLEELGYGVAATAETVEEALAVIDTAVAGGSQIDCAFLDVRLANGAMSWPVAERLADANIPFIFSSGDGSFEVPERFADRPSLPKPYTMDALESVISTL